MLGCQDFCGHYDWTFHYIRRRFGQQAVIDLWADAIGHDSQQHYEKAGAADGLRGLYRVWVQTGEDEKCDWTFTLDESKNVLRLDMRECPSKGFLIKNDLNADEDYCDHCAGWTGPMLEKVGMEIASHEHNHAGQCWWEMRRKDTPFTPLNLDIDIRKDARWNRGFVERWHGGVKQPLLSKSQTDVHSEKVPGANPGKLPGTGGAVDSCDVLRDWFGCVNDLLVLGRGPGAADERGRGLIETYLASPQRGVVVTDPTYATRDVFADEPLAVLIGDQSKALSGVADRFLATPPERRPLLMHMFLPGVPMQDFVSLGLPRPVPILPLLIRAGLYTHRPNEAYPTTGVFLALLAVALGKRIDVAGIDLYRHPSGKMYVSEPDTEKWPPRHSEACDLDCLGLARDRAVAGIGLSPLVTELLNARSTQT
jgi:hypothetical protein